MEKVWCSANPCAAVPDEQRPGFPAITEDRYQVKIRRAQPFIELRAELFRVQPNISYPAWWRRVQALPEYPLW